MTTSWMGQTIETLADLIPARPHALCIGINPAPDSVAAGHYYQGTLGKRFFGRLRAAGILDPSPTGYDDDAAYALGIGFTDIIKRPTASAKDLLPTEYSYGKTRLGTLIANVRPRILIFTFKRAADEVVGRFRGHAWLPQTYLGCSVFVMPGPYAPRQDVVEALETLRPAIRVVWPTAQPHAAERPSS